AFYFAHNKENLYIAAKCTESRMDSLKELAQEHDGPVYNDDCVGFFLAPDFKSGFCYQIYFNPLGVVYDALLKINDEGYPLEVDRSWNAVYGVTAQQGDGYWLIEACFPLSQFDNSESKSWNVNFRRKQQHLGTVSDWLIPVMGTYGRMNLE
ncbi:MAG: hypothetical protein V2A61_00640, partial [Calditrichota bacterium]